ncbi:MAG: hypothetical protein HQ522_06535 [Bacteroidetes bacterium]|nr:hypothetical protein [Bacteroidota bacterium]
MSLRIITGVIDVRGFNAPGSVEIIFNPLEIVSTSRANVLDLKAYGESGYFAEKPFVMMSVNNLTIEDMIDPSGNHNNEIYSIKSRQTLDPENIFQRVIYHRTTMNWEYRGGINDYTQGRVDKISFLIVGDSLPLEETPLQDLPAQPFRVLEMKEGVYLAVGQHFLLKNGDISLSKQLKTDKEMDTAINHLIKKLEEIKKTKSK